MLTNPLQVKKVISSCKRSDNRLSFVVSNVISSMLFDVFETIATISTNYSETLVF